MSNQCHASNLRPGDIVTGVWSEVRGRYDAVRHEVRYITNETFDGVRFTTIRTGPADWQCATYCAETVMRIA